MNSSKNEPKEKRVKQYDELFKLGLGTVAAVLVLISGADKVKVMLTTTSTGAPTLLSVLPMVLFLQTILLGVAWYVSGRYELDLLERYYGKYAPNRRFVTLPLIIFIATIVVVLSYYSDNSLVYSSLYAVYLLFAVSASWLTTQHVLKAFRNGASDSTIPKEYQDEVYLYYVLRPAPVLGYLCGALTFAAITCATIARASSVVASAAKFETISYVFMCLTIFLGEVVVWSWRARLYRRTRDL
jgi:hypothetical protein